MVLQAQGLLVSCEKRTYQPQGGTEMFNYWWLTIADPDNEQPFGIKLHKDFGDRLMSIESTRESYVGKNCVYTIKTSSYNGVRKYQVTDIQESKKS